MITLLSVLKTVQMLLSGMIRQLYGLFLSGFFIAYSGSYIRLIAYPLYDEKQKNRTGNPELLHRAQNLTLANEHRKT